jgi:hypothetical protein
VQGGGRGGGGDVGGGWDGSVQGGMVGLMPSRSGATRGVSVSSLRSNSPLKILEHSIVVVFLELKHVAR